MTIAGDGAGASASRTRQTHPRVMRVLAPTRLGFSRSTWAIWQASVFAMRQVCGYALGVVRSFKGRVRSRGIAGWRAWRADAAATGAIGVFAERGPRRPARVGAHMNGPGALGDSGREVPGSSQKGGMRRPLATLTAISRPPAQRPWPGPLRDGVARGLWHETRRVALGSVTFLNRPGARIRRPLFHVAGPVIDAAARRMGFRRLATRRKHGAFGYTRTRWRAVC